jgi:hypothetical protein
MVQKEVSYSRPPLAAFVLIACTCLPYLGFGSQDAQRSPRKLSKIEIKLSGPASVRPNESLAEQNFKALLTNRSAEPQVFIVRSGYLMDANWNWSVTDTKGWPIGIEFISRGFCGTIPHEDPNSRFLHDNDVFVLGPGERHEFPIPGGPSDDYNFPSAGRYHVSVTLTYVPPNADHYFDEQGKRQSASGYAQWDLSRLGADSFVELENSLSVQATSDTRNLELPSKRRARP